MISRRRRREIVARRASARATRPVDDADLGNPGIDQRRDHRPRRPAGAEDHRGPAARVANPGRPRAGSRETRTHRYCSPRDCRPAATTIVFTAPMRRASGSTRSTTASAACLCGIVRLHPRNPSAGSARSACSDVVRPHRQRHIGAVDAVSRRARSRAAPANANGRPATP